MSFRKYDYSDDETNFESESDFDEDNVSTEEMIFLSPKYGTYINTIGEGVSGKVFHYKKGNKHYAIKRIEQESRNIPISFIIETCALKRLSQSENNVNIVKLINIEINSNEHRYYIVMHFYPNDLNSIFLKRKKCLSIDKIKKYAKDISLGIKCCQDCNILHSDIKLDNILVSKKDQLKIADFGTAQIGYCNNIKNRIAYTLSYRAPEIIIGNNNYTDKADSWALGIILYELEKGEKLFHEEDETYTLYSIFSKLGTPSKRLYNRLKDEYAEKYEKIPNYTGNDYLFSKNKQLNNLIKKLLVIDPKKRLSIEEALSHPFINLKVENMKCVDKLRKYEYVHNYKHPKRAKILKNLYNKAKKTFGEYLIPRDFVLAVQILDRYLENNKYEKGLGISCFILSILTREFYFEEEGEFVNMINLQEKNY